MAAAPWGPLILLFCGILVTVTDAQTIWATITTVTAITATSTSTTTSTVSTSTTTTTTITATVTSTSTATATTTTTPTSTSTSTSTLTSTSTSTMTSTTTLQSTTFCAVLLGASTACRRKRRHHWMEVESDPIEVSPTSVRHVSPTAVAPLLARIAQAPSSASVEAIQSSIQHPDSESRMADPSPQVGAVISTVLITSFTTTTTTKTQTVPLNCIPLRSLNIGLCNNVG